MESQCNCACAAEFSCHLAGVQSAERDRLALADGRQAAGQRQSHGVRWRQFQQVCAAATFLGLSAAQ